MLKRTACLIALLAGNPLLLAGQGTETTLKPHKKEVWPLLKKIKRTCVNHPVVATLGVATAITAATAYVSTTYTSTEIVVRINFQNTVYVLKNIQTSSTMGFLLKGFIGQLDRSYKNPAYLYSVSYKKKKINLNDYQKKLDALGIENNAELQVFINKQPITLTVQYVDGELKEELTIQADKRNTFFWLKKQILIKQSGKISIGRQMLTFKEIGNSLDTIPQDNEKLSDYEVFKSSDKGVIELCRRTE